MVFIELTFAAAARARPLADGKVTAQALTELYLERSRGRIRNFGPESSRATSSRR